MSEDFKLGFAFGILCTVLALAVIGYFAAITGFRL